ncbi:MAG: 50S ribosomal protein L10 [Candidatus Cloacimonas sp. 4484_209]|nr:MAG: 50S ribosomal protein L10 [Candidatus Cloacimonas sp. 4484_209]
MERPSVNQKKEEVKLLVDKLKKSTSFYIVDFSGLNANEMNDLRNRFKSNNFDYFVTKNTILKFASEKVGLEEISQVLTGPNAISISYEDPIGPAKIINDFYKERELPKVKLCYIEGKWYGEEEVRRIAKLPAKEVLIGQVVNLINAPINHFVTVLGNIITNFVCVVEEIRKSKELSQKQEEVEKSEKSSTKKETEEVAEKPKEENSEDVKEEKKEVIKEKPKEETKEETEADANNAKKG